MSICSICRTTGLSSALIFYAHSPATFRSSCRFIWASHPHTDSLLATLQTFIDEHNVRDKHKATFDHLERSGAWKQLWAVLEEEGVLDDGKWKEDKKWKTAVQKIKRKEIVDIIRAKIREKVGRMVTTEGGIGKTIQANGKDLQKNKGKSAIDSEGGGPKTRIVSTADSTVGTSTSTGCKALIRMPPLPPASTSRELIPGFRIPSVTSFFGPFEGLGAVPPQGGRGWGWGEMDLWLKGVQAEKEEGEKMEKEEREKKEREREEKKEKERKKQDQKQQQEQKGPQRQLRSGKLLQQLKPRESPVSTAAAAAIPVQQLVRQPVQQPVQQYVQQLVQQPVQQLVQQPVQQYVQQPVQQLVQQPVQQYVQQPVRQHVQQPARQPAQRLAQQLVQQPVQRLVQQPAQQPVQPLARQPVQRLVPQPVQQSTRPLVPKPSIPPSDLKDDFDALADSFARKQALEDRLRQIEELRRKEKGATIISRPVTPASPSPQKTRTLPPTQLPSPASSWSPSPRMGIKDELRREIAPAGSTVEAHRAIREEGEAGEGEGEEAYEDGGVDGPDDLAFALRGVGVEVAPAAGSKAEAHPAIKEEEARACEEGEGKSGDWDGDGDAEEKERPFQLRTDFTPLSALRAANQSIEAKMSVLRIMAGWMGRE
ncbi:hypothetical protein LZ554_009553 [Drepanopeziza brunnea f. sp. 'monogermtubi']|nr:hypothetical protein LZ554_009553 [Drepanopeziza brunnea f. sp. 'monogermtubi']